MGSDQEGLVPKLIFLPEAGAVRVELEDVVEVSGSRLLLTGSEAPAHGPRRHWSNRGCGG